MIPENATILDDASKNGLLLAVFGLLALLLFREDGRLTVEEFAPHCRVGRRKAFALIR